VVFLRKVPTASGATAVQIARRENRRDVVIEHLGSAHTDAELAALMQIGRRKIEEGQGVLDLGLDADQDPGAAIVQTQASQLLIDTVSAAWQALGFDVITDEAFFQLVLARVVEPTSMSDAVRVLSELGVTPAHRNTFSATLRRCGQRGYRDQIATACFNDATAHGDVSLCLYDVTTLLCRRRHNSVYADLPVMPISDASLQVRPAGMAQKVGIIKGGRASRGCRVRGGRSRARCRLGGSGRSRPA